MTLSNNPIVGTIYVMTITIAITILILTYLLTDVPKFSSFVVSMVFGMSATLSAIIAEVRE